ncbi:hypothetical protein DAI22_07g124300 [Oryza sativa Japonica Group]|nr:hypothetical protein DAI22_07g124300 [Oryza sativa Japonica Group]
MVPPHAVSPPARSGGGERAAARRLHCRLAVVRGPGGEGREGTAPPHPHAPSHPPPRRLPSCQIQRRGAQRHPPSPLSAHRGDGSGRRGRGDEAATPVLPQHATSPPARFGGADQSALPPAVAVVGSKRGGGRDKGVRGDGTAACASLPARSDGRERIAARRRRRRLTEGRGSGGGGERGRRHHIHMRCCPRGRMPPTLPLDPAEGSALLPVSTRITVSARV